jgi:hypothetical protein
VLLGLGGRPVALVFPVHRTSWSDLLAYKFSLFLIRMSRSFTTKRLQKRPNVRDLRNYSRVFFTIVSSSGGHSWASLASFGHRRPGVLIGGVPATPGRPVAAGARRRHPLRSGDPTGRGNARNHAFRRLRASLQCRFHPSALP